MRFVPPEASASVPHFSTTRAVSAALNASCVRPPKNAIAPSVAAIFARPPKSIDERCPYATSDACWPPSCASA